MAESAKTTLRYANPLESQAPIPTLRVLFEGERGVVDRPARYLGDDEELVIGRAVKKGGLELADQRASRRHATIYSHLGAVQITDTSSNGTFVNGQSVKKMVLNDGDVIRTGDSFMLLRYVPSGINDVAIAGILGKAPSMCGLRRTIATLANNDVTVLVLGESGTGKELVARALHNLSSCSGPFVAVNCSAIPETLAESQFFGHVAGSFTGASGDRRGHFREAHGGTLFLDEIGEMPHRLQPKLLRVLEDHTVTPVGGSRAEPVEVRVIAATNLELSSAVEDGRFRGDLYSRLAEITLRTPPLRERREDILSILVNSLRPDAPGLTPNLASALLLHHWPFNVRELVTVARQLSIYGAAAQKLDLAMVENRLDEAPSNPGMRIQEAAAPNPPKRRARTTGPHEVIPSREQLLSLVTETKGNISALSRKLGRSRRQVYRYLEKHGIDLDAYR